MKFLPVRFLWLGVVFALFLSPAAQAQQIPEAAFGTASPGRIQQDRAAREMVPTEIPGLQLEQVRPPDAPDGADQITFKLRGVGFDGATIYSAEELTALYADKIGTVITLTDVYRIAAALTRKYRDDGYILTRVVVPPQTIETGTVRLRAVEGFIGDIKVEEGDEAGSPAVGLVHRYLAQVNRRGPLNGAQLERALLLINDLPGMRARAVLSPSKKLTGASDLLVILSRDTFGGELSVDNFGTRYMGPVEYNATTVFNSQFARNNERVTLRGIFVPSRTNGRKEMLYGMGSYFQPVGDSGATLEFTASNANTWPGYLLRQFRIHGVSTYYAATLSYPFVRSRNTNLNGHVTLDHRTITTTNNLPGDPRREDRLRALRVGARFQKLDLAFFGPAFNIIDVEMTHGLDVLNATDGNAATLSRPAAGPHFMKLTGEVQRLQNLAGPINLLLGVKGQITNTPLLSSEQFGLGGTGYGRGYDPSEIIGDRGIAGTVELQWNQPYKFDWTDSYQLYAFWDAGEVRNVKLNAATTDTSSIASAGIGARFTINPMTSAGFLVAAPLTREVAAFQTRSRRVFFNISRRF